MRPSRWYQRSPWRSASSISLGLNLFRKTVSILSRGSLMRVFFCSLLFVLLALCGAVAQNPTPVVQANTIYSGADGKFEASPDTAVLRLDIAAQQDTPKAAFDHVAATADRVRQVLRAN